MYPYNYAVTSSTRVIVYDAHTRKPMTTLSRFKDKAYSGTFRIDGKLLVAGGESGIVQVWEAVTAKLPYDCPAGSPSCLAGASLTGLSADRCLTRRQTRYCGS